MQDQEMIAIVCTYLYQVQLLWWEPVLLASRTITLEIHTTCKHEVHVA